jgi:hypothetical protein
VDFKKGVLRVHGSKTDAADREVPLIPAARVLLQRLHETAAASTQVAQGDDPQVNPQQSVITTYGMLSQRRPSKPESTFRRLLPGWVILTAELS